MKATPGIKAGSLILIESLKAEAVAVAELIVDTDTLVGISSGEIAKPKSVLMTPGTYPQSWSKSS